MRDWAEGVREGRRGEGEEKRITKREAKMSSLGENELQKFLLAQIEEINRYKWIESEKRQHDIGFQRAAMEWIGQYSACFKKDWKRGKPRRGGSLEEGEA